MVDHCPAHDEFSSAFYLKTKTTIEKISKNLAKTIKYHHDWISRSGYMEAQKMDILSHFMLPLRIGIS